MDAEGGRPSSWVNAAEFPSIQAAIDAAEPGSVIQIPSGLYSENLLVNKKLTLLGDQIGENPFIATGQAGTVLTPTGPNNHAITVVSPAGLVQIRNLRIQGDDVSGSGDGIHIVGNSPSERVSTVVIDSVFITAVGRHGVYCKEVDFPLLQNVHCVANKGGGMWFENSAQVLCMHCYSLNNEGVGVRLATVTGFQWFGIGIQGNQRSESSTADDAQFDAEYSTEIIIGRTDFEDFTGHSAANTAIALGSCGGVNILGNGFFNPSVGGRAIYIGNNNQGISVGSNKFQNVELGIEVARFNPPVVDPVSSNIHIAGQDFRNAVTTRIKLPPTSESSGRGIAVVGAEGILPPVFLIADRPAPSSSESDGNVGRLIFVPDGPSSIQKIQFSDGTSWIDLDGNVVG
jgi:hypothetical protein